MPSVLYGASSEEWAAFAALCLSDLLPTVCDPRVSLHPRAERSGPSVDKVPSNIDEQGFAYRIKGWSRLVTTGVSAWANNPALGICVVGRTMHAIDIDIEDRAPALRAEGVIRETLGINGMLLPARRRSNSGKCLLMYRLADAPPRLKKTVVPLPGVGMVEFLHDGQQFRVAGRHATGVRLEWDALPTRIEDIPVLTVDELTEVHRALAAAFDTNFNDDILSQVQQPGVRKASQVDSKDPMVLFLHANDHVRNIRADGTLDLFCPWANEHRHPTPDNESEASFFPIGLGEIKNQPGFKCLHATCNGRTWQALLNKIGFHDAEFPLIDPAGPLPVTARPNLSYKGKSQIIEATLPNIVAMLRWHDGFGYTIRYDSFKDAIVYHSTKDTAWCVLDDDTYTIFRLQLHAMGMDPSVPIEHVRNAVSFVARERAVNTAQEWLKALEPQWDGIKRIERFHVNALNVANTPYHRAVSMYLWTGLAGRVMDPGCKADMVPILTGKTGMRKSTLAETLAPSPDEYTALSLTDRDADLARQLRGKLIAEWDEMKGMNTRDSESIKAWVSRRRDEWVPKFKEYGVAMPRHFLLIGTANEKQLLNDPTGSRRWLPVRIENMIDTDYIVTYRDQLWAEAVAVWRETGIQWQEAERLALAAHKAATVRDLWEDVVRMWIAEQGGGDGWSSMQLLSGACSVPMNQANRATYERIRRIMVRLGYDEDDNGRWYCNIA